MNKTTKPKDAVSAAFKASLDEAVKHARGRKARVKVEILNVRTTGEDVRQARQILNVSQPQFARLMVVSSETVKKWEQNKNPIPASVGYWVVGLKVRPGITKKLLFELAGRPGVRRGRAVGHRVLAGHDDHEVVVAVGPQLNGYGPRALTSVLCATLAPHGIGTAQEEARDVCGSPCFARQRGGPDR